jgi:hypothetical protein
MPKYEKYYVVEFRFPIKIDEADSIPHAVSKASRMCERIHGFKPDNWFARIFEYQTGESRPGLTREYFYNPNSNTHREISKNIGYHQDMVDKGLSPQDIEDSSFFDEGEDENILKN